MKALWKKFQVCAIAVSVCMLILGTVMLVWPDISAVTICVILGALCAAAGVYKLVRYFRLVAHRGVIRYQLEIHGAKVRKNL